jgi:hypothetical protein
MVTDARFDLVSLNRARRELIPLNEHGRPVSPSTVWRWIMKGLPGPDGERIRLAVTYCGRRPYTTAEDVEEFFRQVTEAKQERARRARETAAHVSDDELRAAGLLKGGAK